MYAKQTQAGVKLARRHENFGGPSEISRLVQMKHACTSACRVPKIVRIRIKSLQFEEKVGTKFLLLIFHHSAFPKSLMHSVYIGELRLARLYYMS